MTAIEEEALDAEATALCERSVELLLEGNDGMVFAMVATADGFPVASAAAPGWDVAPNRLAAMASSGHALGDTVAGEMADAACDDVIIDADRLSIVFLGVPGTSQPPLLLGVAATKSTSLGNVLVDARGCARGIAEGLPSAA